MFTKQIASGTGLVWTTGGRGEIKGAFEQGTLRVEAGQHAWEFSMPELYELLCTRWALYEQEQGKQFVTRITFELLDGTVQGARNISEWAKQYKVS